MTRPTSDRTQERWQKEAEFFDRWAEETATRLTPTARSVIERYRSQHRRRFAMEYRYRLMGDLRGKRVLDAGCGDGINSVIFAALGAETTGIDISPGAIEVANKRAELDGVADRTTFVCAPLETADVEEHAFDVVWVDAFLHHVLPDLETVLTKLRRWIKPGGMILMMEPVNFSPWLRRLRFAVAAESEHTPDERPLEQADFDIVRRVFPELEVRYYHGIARLERYILPDHKYETAALWRRALLNGLNIFDYALLSLPPLQPLAGIAVVSARLGK
jgi:2-polyprenyl-3-methyl-5-hydroxy-6-metoxy-1,4-benzoquinol methylase